MIDLLDRAYQPTLDEISDLVRSPAFDSFCKVLEAQTGASHTLSYSSCSWMPGWNIKFRKGSRSACTVYPKEGFFTVLVVIGKAEKSAAEELLPTCTDTLRRIYNQTQEGSGQRWLMIDLEDADDLYRDTLNLINLRIFGKKKKL